MKTHSTRIISLLLAVVLAASLLPQPARAAELSYSYTPVSNTGAVITANAAVTASLDDPALATLSQSGSTVTIAAKPGAVGIVTVRLTVGTQTEEVQVPLGYTTFRFHGDSLTVIPGSDSGYEITGINEQDEEYLEGDPSYPLPSTTDENGDPVYTNTDRYKICVCVKKKGGTFVFDGTADDMSIAVKKEATGPAVLLLGDLSLTSSFTAPLTVRKNSASTVTVTTLAGHTATLEDSQRNNADLYGETNLLAESAVIKAKTGARLTLNGSGTLKLNCKTKNAVKAGQSASLTVESGDLAITSAGHGLSADHTLNIQGGSVSVDAQGDTIRSDPDTVDAESGYAGCVNISGGTLTLRAGSDGIQAAQDVTISGGVFDIQTGNGYQDKTSSDSRKGIKASHTNDETTDTSEATNTITVTGGEFLLNTADDAVHSDAYVNITGGTFRIRTGDDGVHADTRLTLGTQGDTGPLPDVQVLQSYEGLEAGHVYIHSGTYRVIASDDGINAAGGSSGDNFNPGGGGWPGRPGRPGGGGSSGSSGDYTIQMTGGDVYVNVSSDGLDSNGSIELTGGNLVVFGNSAGLDGEPLDCDGALTIKGATVFGAGSRMMVTTPGSASQPYVRYTSNTVSGGKTINVKHNNETVFNIKAVKDINYVIYSSPAMTSATGWTITFDDSPVIEPDDPCKNGHSWDSGVTTPAACTQPGRTVLTCTVCGTSQTQTIPALGHDYAENTVQPSCTKAGYTDHTCSRCGDTYRDAETPALGHAEVLRGEKAAACTAAGYTGDTVCTRCGETLRSGSTVPAAGHKWGEWVTVTPATDEQEGSQTRACASCGQSETKTVPALGHDIVTDPAVAPTCTQPGLTEGAHCAACDYKVPQQEIPALGHSFENGVCTRCGEPDPSQHQPCGGGDTCPGRNYTDMPAADNWAHAGIDYCLENGLMNGSTGTAFDPKGTMTRAMAATVLYRMAGSPAVTGANPFADVQAGRYYEKAVVWANQVGIVTGRNPSTFAPNDNVTRQELVVMIARYAANVEKRDVTPQGSLSAYADASTVSGFAVASFTWAVDNGVINGTAGNLAPRQTATRAEVAAILMRCCKLS